MDTTKKIDGDELGICLLQVPKHSIFIGMSLGFACYRRPNIRFP